MKETIQFLLKKYEDKLKLSLSAPPDQLNQKEVSCYKEIIEDLKLLGEPVIEDHVPFLHPK